MLIIIIRPMLIINRPADADYHYPADADYYLADADY
jgi:hypothetical protein